MTKKEKAIIQAMERKLHKAYNDATQANRYTLIKAWCAVCNLMVELGIESDYTED